MGSSSADADVGEGDRRASDAHEAVGTEPRMRSAMRSAKWLAWRSAELQGVGGCSFQATSTAAISPRLRAHHPTRKKTRRGGSERR